MYLIFDPQSISAEEVNKNRELQLILSPEQYVNYLQMFEKEKKKTQ